MIMQDIQVNWLKNVFPVYKKYIKFEMIIKNYLPLSIAQSLAAVDGDWLAEGRLSPNELGTGWVTDDTPWLGRLLIGERLYVVRRVCLVPVTETRSILFFDSVCFIRYECR